MDLFGLLDAQNVPVAVAHYTAPTLILLWFVFASSVPADGAATAGTARGRTSENSQVMKWVFMLAVMSFVYLLGQMGTYSIRLLMGLWLLFEH